MRQMQSPCRPQATPAQIIMLAAGLAVVLPRARPRQAAALAAPAEHQLPVGRGDDLARQHGVPAAAWSRDTDGGRVFDAFWSGCEPQSGNAA